MVIDFTSTPETGVPWLQGDRRPGGDSQLLQQSRDFSTVISPRAKRRSSVSTRMQEELEMYQLALEVLPTFRRARNNLGVGLKRRGRVEEAIEQYKMAIEVEGEFPGRPR